jgi:hypothetical protein
VNARDLCAKEWFYNKDVDGYVERVTNLETKALIHETPSNIGARSAKTKKK